MTFISGELIVSSYVRICSRQFARHQQSSKEPYDNINDIHDWHKMAGEETRKLVWEGKLPVCFCLHPDEVRDVRRDMSLESCYVSFICCTV